MSDVTVQEMRNENRVKEEVLLEKYRKLMLGMSKIIR
jgi:hypothetical protein